MVISVISFPACCAYHIVQNLPLQTVFFRGYCTPEEVLRLVTQEKAKIRNFFAADKAYAELRNSNVICILNQHQVKQGVGQMLKDEGFALTDVQRNANTELLVYTYTKRSERFLNEDMKVHFAEAA